MGRKTCENVLHMCREKWRLNDNIHVLRTSATIVVADESHSKCRRQLERSVSRTLQIDSAVDARVTQQQLYLTETHRQPPWVELCLQPWTSLRCQTSLPRQTMSYRVLEEVQWDRLAHDSQPPSAYGLQQKHASVLLLWPEPVLGCVWALRQCLHP